MTPTVSRMLLSRRVLPLLLAAFLAALVFGLEFHHHDDGRTHTDCSVCAAVHQTRSASLQRQETGSPVIARAYLVLPSSLPDPVSRHLAVPVIRPPPA